MTTPYDITLEELQKAWLGGWHMAHSVGGGSLELMLDPGLYELKVVDGYVTYAQMTKDIFYEGSIPQESDVLHPGIRMPLRVYKKQPWTFDVDAGATMSIIKRL